MSTTLGSEAISTVENEATQTDWMGDLSGGLGSDPAAGRGRCAAASGRAGPRCGAVGVEPGVALGASPEDRAPAGRDGVLAVRAARAAAAHRASGYAGHGDRR